MTHQKFGARALKTLQTFLFLSPKTTDRTNPDLTHYSIPKKTYHVIGVENKNQNSLSLSLYHYLYAIQNSSCSHLTKKSLYFPVTQIGFRRITIEFRRPISCLEKPMCFRWDLSRKWSDPLLEMNPTGRSCCSCVCHP